MLVALTLLGFLGWAGALLLSIALVGLILWLVLHGEGPGGHFEFSSANDAGG